MSNTFVALPVPTSVGVGASVDVSELAAEKTLVVEGDSTGVLVIEGSHNGSSFAPLLTLDLFQDPGALKVRAVVSHMRVRRQSGNGTVAIALGAESTDQNLFATLDVPSGTGPGSITSVSGLGPEKTLNIVGSYDTAVVVEGTNDGVNFDPLVTLDTGGSQSVSFTGVYSGMRVRRVSGGTPPVVTVGGGPVGTGGGGGGSSATTILLFSGLMEGTTFPATMRLGNTGNLPSSGGPGSPIQAGEFPMPAGRTVVAMRAWASSLGFGNTFTVPVRVELVSQNVPVSGFHLSILPGQVNVMLVATGSFVIPSPSSPGVGGLGVAVFPNPHGFSDQTGNRVQVQVSLEIQ